MHGLTRASSRPVLPADPDQEEMVPAHFDRHLLTFLLPDVHVVRLRDGLRLSLRTVQED